MRGSPPACPRRAARSRRHGSGRARRSRASTAATTMTTATTRKGEENTMKLAPHRLLLAAAVASALAWAPPGDARVTRVVVDRTETLTNPFDKDKPYQLLIGRAFGELDPASRHNELLTDLPLADRNANGWVPYIASFVIRKPENNAAISGVMWHDVPNRGRDVGFPRDSFAANDVQLVSGWQGDNASGTTVPARADCLPETGCTPPDRSLNHFVKTPVLGGVTGRIFARIVNRTGVRQPLNVQNGNLPYFPANAADNSGATLEVHSNETVNGVV